MNLSDVMDSLGEALETIEGLRVTPYHADRVTPPAAIVGWPDSYAFDNTMVRGSDRIVFPVTILVGKSDARSSAKLLSAYCDGSGDSSVKSTIDEHGFPFTARVASVEFGVLSVAGVEYLAATFDIEVVG